MVNNMWLIAKFIAVIVLLSITNASASEKSDDQKVVSPKEIGKETGLPLPRFVTFKSNETNWRNGPGNRYPIKWVYNQRGYPVQVIAEFDNWRKVRDRDGEDGWVHEALISGHRNVIIIDNVILSIARQLPTKQDKLLLFRRPNEESYPMARIEIGVLAKVKKCTAEWCEIQTGGYKGWARKQNLWGVTPDEIIK